MGFQLLRISIYSDPEKQTNCTDENKIATPWMCFNLLKIKINDYIYRSIWYASITMFPPRALTQAVLLHVYGCTDNKYHPVILNASCYCWHNTRDVSGLTKQVRHHPIISHTGSMENKFTNIPNRTFDEDLAENIE